MPEIIIINSGQKAELLPADSSFCHGYALFETMRVDSKRLLCWKAHWDRLKLSAQQLGIQCDYDESAVITAIRELVQSDNINDGILKLSLCSEQLFVYARTTLPLPLGPVRLKLDTSSPLNEHSPIAGHKMHNYAENWHLLNAARADSYHDVLRINTAGFLTETAAANFFFIHNNSLHSPSLCTGALPGVTRQIVLRSARQAEINTQEGSYLIDTLRNIDAAFITNASFGIIPVDSIEGEALEIHKSSQTHPVVSRLIELVASAQDRDLLLL